MLRGDFVQLRLECYVVLQSMLHGVESEELEQSQDEKQRGWGWHAYVHAMCIS